MKPVKTEYLDESPFSNYVKLEQHSAFRLYQQESSEKIEFNIGTDMETYINNRKCQNSFTLADISVSQSEKQSIDIKVESSRQTQETNVPENIVQMKAMRKGFQIVFAFQESYVPKPILKRLFSLQISPNLLSQSIFPVPKSSRDHHTQVQQKVQLSSSDESEDHQKLENSDHSSDDVFKIEKEQNSKKLKKNQKIKQKNISQKFNQGEIRTKKSNRSDNNPVKTTKQEKKQKDTLKMSSQRYPNKKQQIEQIPFDGVLRNCSCCGKLISKLCFKCPHIYCKAENCPRKRKKILNEKMLERMKQQKIQQHYRQRQLYEKMKLQKGNNLHSKFINTRQKFQKVIKNGQGGNKANLKNKIELEESISSGEFQSSEGEINQEQLFDSSAEEQSQEFKKKSRFAQKKKEQNLEESKMNKKNIQNSNSKPKKTKILNRRLTQYQRNSNNQYEKKKNFEHSDSFITSILLSDIEEQEKEGKKHKIAPIQDCFNKNQQKLPKDDERFKQKFANQNEKQGRTGNLKKKKLQLYFNKDEQNLY